jgi:hypothetical protein
MPASRAELHRAGWKDHAMPNEKPKLDAEAALQSTLISPNEADSNSEPANVVDGLFVIARAIEHLADAIQWAQGQRAR